MRKSRRSGKSKSKTAALIPDDIGIDGREDDSQILRLSQSVRVRVWNILGYSHTGTLRLVCSTIKSDIDTAAGVSSAIDSNFEDFPFHCQIAIRKVAIHELITPPYVEFLRYPLTLTELEIRGEISAKTFHYIINSCPNITKILIVFNKFVLDYAAPLLPIPKEVLSQEYRPLSKISAIKLIGTTKNEPELDYVKNFLACLLVDTLPRSIQLSSLQIMMSHRCPHITFREMAMTAVVFVHQHAPTLHYLNLMFRDKDPHTVTSEKPQQPQQQPQRRASGAGKPGSSSSDSSIRKDSAYPAITVTKTKAPQPSHPDHAHKDVHKDVEPTVEKDSDDQQDELNNPEGEGEANVEEEDSDEEPTNEGITAATNYLAKNAWENAPNLRNLILSVPYKVMQHLTNVVSSVSRLDSLSLEAIGSLAHHTSNWQIYVQFLKRGNVKFLKTAGFHHVNNANTKGKVLPVDLRVFRKCKQLTKLTLLCEKKDDFIRLCEANNVRSLPPSINEIHFERLRLSPCQVFRLIFCFPDMKSLSISYWSISDSQFSRLMCLLKWGVKFHLTSSQIVNLVDTKIRFRNSRKAVRRLQEAVQFSTRYHDFDETKLVLENKYPKTDRRFAPRLTQHEPEPHYVRRARRPTDKKGVTTNSVMDLSRLTSISSKTSVF